MARYKSFKLGKIEEKIMVHLRPNLPFGMQSSDYPEPEIVTKPTKEPALVIPERRKRQLRPGRKRTYAANAEKQRAYRDRKRSKALRNSLRST